MPKKAVWKLALNVNPSDEHSFGYGGPCGCFYDIKRRLKRIFGHIRATSGHIGSMLRFNVVQGILPVGLYYEPQPYRISEVRARVR